MFNKKSVLLIVSVFLITLLLASAVNASTLDDILSEGKLTVSTELGMPPLAYEDAETGEPTGLLMEIAREYANQLGVELEVKSYAWSGVVPALTEGKVDMIAAGLTRTVPRTTKMLFTEPVFNNPCKMLVRKDSNIDSLEDINQNGVVITISTGSVWEKVAANQFPEAEIKTVPTNSDNATALHANRADAYINGRTQLEAAKNQYKDEFEILPGVVSDNVFAFAVRHGDTKLRYSFNTYMRNMKSSGDYAELFEEFMGYEWNPTIETAN